MFRLRVVFFLIMALGVSSASHAQLREIDRAKLPQEAKVLDAYDDLIPFNESARNFTTKWDYPLSKKDTAKHFEKALSVFEDAQKKNPDNVEILLLTGLTAHLAYNLEVTKAYPVALDMLGKAYVADSKDPRSLWFRGMHQCESSDVLTGMENLLRVEKEHEELPADFWSDYALCAPLAGMPAHGAVALDRASALGDNRPTNVALSEVLHRMLAPGDPTHFYPAKEAWRIESVADRNVRITSFPCGIRFDMPAESDVTPGDLENGVCHVEMTPPGYNRALAHRAPTFVVLSRPAQFGETLRSFASKIANRPGSHVQTANGLQCPVAHCISFEIRAPEMYTDAGGGHMLMLAFESPVTHYPGLDLEYPHDLPHSDSGKTTVYHPTAPPRHFPVNLYTVVIMDASEDIYEHAHDDFLALLASIKADSQ